VEQQTLTTRPVAGSTDDLELTRERVKTPVNGFLEAHHPRGGVPGWKACFAARHRTDLVAALVLSRPVARHADDGTRLDISRFARRDDRPPNTGSWLIARGRLWSALEGYDELVAYAGVAGNNGTVYQAAGFELRETAQAAGDRWTNRHGRDSWQDYTRRKWVYDLEELV